MWLEIKLCSANVVFSGGKALKIVLTLFLKTTECIFSIKNTPVVRLFETETINLSGLVLNPGDTLTIDTDAITAERNGANAIEYWQAGSRPFNLTNGENIISYFDGNTSRNAEITVIWRERWL